MADPAKCRCSGRPTIWHSRVWVCRVCGQKWNLVKIYAEYTYLAAYKWERA